MDAESINILADVGVQSGFGETMRRVRYPWLPRVPFGRLDSDGDRVSNRRDCSPFNPFKQDRISKRQWKHIAEMLRRRLTKYMPPSDLVVDTAKFPQLSITIDYLNEEVRDGRPFVSPTVASEYTGAVHITAYQEDRSPLFFVSGDIVIPAPKTRLKSVRESAVEGQTIKKLDVSGEDRRRAERVANRMKRETNVQLTGVHEHKGALHLHVRSPYPREPQPIDDIREMYRVVETLFKIMKEWDK